MSNNAVFIELSRLQSTSPENMPPGVGQAAQNASDLWLIASQHMKGMYLQAICDMQAVVSNAMRDANTLTEFLNNYNAAISQLQAKLFPDGEVVPSCDSVLQDHATLATEHIE